MQFTCPVCGYANLPELPTDFTICNCCGSQFDYRGNNAIDDRSHEELRRDWVAKGCNWWSERVRKPAEWQPQMQLVELYAKEDAIEQEYSIIFNVLGNARFGIQAQDEVEAMSVQEMRNLLFRTLKGN